jgi:5-methylcytosine-specific restriction endonuclease McrA
MRESDAKICERCGRGFSRNAKESKRQWSARRFCSRSCAAQWREEAHPRKRAEGICRACELEAPFHADRLCRPCWDRQRYQANREQILAQNRVWREANRDYWRQEHIVDRVRRWHADHPDRTREITRNALRRRRARLTGAELGSSDLVDGYSRVLAADPCSYCHQASEHIDHIVAISKGGEHAWENLTAACSRCNRAKYSGSLLAFLLGQRPQTGHGDGPAWS